MRKRNPIYVSQNKSQATSFIKSKTGKVVGLFLAGTVAISGYLWLQEEKRDDQNTSSSGSGGGSGGSGYSSRSSTKGTGSDTISTGSAAAKGGIGSSAVGGGG